MAVIGDLIVRLGADSRGFSRKMDSAQKRVSKFRSVIGKVGTGAAGVLTAGLAQAGLGSVFGAVERGITAFAKAEQAQVGFATLIGSAEKAKVVLSDLGEFAASTPLQLTDLTDASRKLLAFGTSADSVVEELRRIGDISAGIGQPIGEIAEIYGKARVQGRLFAEDINQLTGRGIPIIQELAKQFGVTDSEVRKLVTNGEVGFDNLEAAFVAMTSTGGRFNNMMAAQSQTLSGLWSTLQDNISLALKEIATRLNETFDFRRILRNMTEFVKGSIDLLDRMGQSWRNLQRNIAEGMATLMALVDPDLNVDDVLAEFHVMDRVAAEQKAAAERARDAALANFEAAQEQQRAALAMKQLEIPEQPILEAVNRAFDRGLPEINVMQDVKSVGALERGSAAAFSTILRAQRQQEHKVLQQTLKANLTTAAATSVIANAVTNAPPVGLIGAF